ncbi:hypothetical protein [Alkalihalobacillus sp. R86527]|uniref:hypothetical protein n=1 Tax=Alkalihalobacillus sp. R86527 TaxID=3093863 RepID=UPI00366A8197
MKKSFINFLIITSLAFVITACGNDATDQEPNSGQTNNETKQSEETEETKTTSEESPTPDEAAIEMAVDSIKDYDMVKDAAIAVDGNDISFAIIANSSVTEETAKELGDNFVRMLGSFSGGESPSKDYYGGLYDDYSALVKVADSSEEEIMMGAMSKGTQRITW